MVAAAARARAFLRDAWMLAKPYWQDKRERPMALFLLVVIVALNLASVALDVWFNSWYNDFYNALQEKDFDSFKKLLLYFSLVAAAFIIVAVYKLYLQQLLILRWRRWLTDHWVKDWLGRRHFYHMQMLGLDTDNPDQRLAEDLKFFPTYALNLTLGLMSAFVSLVSFLGILWTLSGDFSFTLGGHEFSIPGFMVWVAFLYAAAGTIITHMIGKPLTRLNFNQQRVEADFRFHLMRVRENAEGIAFQRGEAVEGASLARRFGAVFDNFFLIMQKTKQLTWFTTGYGQAALIFPFLVGAPRYFSGAIQLGALMQISSAFGQVQTALSYIVESYPNIAEWRAVTDRLTGFRLGLLKAAELQAENHIHVEAAAGAEKLKISNLALDLPNDGKLLAVPTLEVPAGQSLLIEGRSGSGKSTLLRAMAGLWLFGRGRVARASEDESLFLPQKPYLPLGSLRAALSYPHPPERYSEGDYTHALSALGLEAFASRLDEEAHWAQVLSGGEAQRVQFVRALLARPKWLFLDEATAALDAESEAALLGALRKEMPGTAIISIGHRPALAEFHQHRMRLEATASGDPARLISVSG